MLNTSQSAKRAVLLMNLGSPDSTAVPDVKKYLNEFLMDERVIDIPYIARLLLIKGIIVPRRAPNSAEAYKEIWTDKGSPLVETTRQLQHALQQQVDIPVEIAMRYIREIFGAPRFSSFSTQSANRGYLGRGTMDRLIYLKTATERRASLHSEGQDYFLRKCSTSKGAPNVRQYPLEHGWIGCREKRR